MIVGFIFSKQSKRPTDRCICRSLLLPSTLTAKLLKVFERGLGKTFFKAGSLEQVSKPPHDAAIKETCDKTKFSPDCVSEINP